MKKISFLDADMQVAMEDIERRKQEIVRECIKVWDSMSGKLPSFQGFCEMYMREQFKVWADKARWN